MNNIGVVKDELESGHRISELRSGYVRHAHVWPGCVLRGLIM